jgi:Ras-related GTP-binding protein A/B
MPLTLHIFPRLYSQEAFMENYFTSQRDHIFKNVEVLIYVFDVESRDVERDMHYYQSCLEAIMANSREAKIFCLVHKMDLVQEHQRDKVSMPLDFDGAHRRLIST